MKLEKNWVVNLKPRQLPKIKDKKRKWVMVINGPFEIIIPCPSLPTADDAKIAQWVCNSLNWSKQRTEEIIDEVIEIKPREIEETKDNDGFDEFWDDVKKEQD